MNPQLDANLKPIEPSSPVINSGNNAPAGGLPTSDYDGGKRLIGTKVDRGAYESNVNNAPILTVTNTNNSGAGSLRQAILDSNSSPDEKSIEFDIVGACPRVITPTTTLPALVAPVTIAGYSQPGSVQNTYTSGFAGNLCIALSGGGGLANGLHLQTGAGQIMTVEGIAFHGFTSEAVLISGTGAGNVRGNAFGTGTTASFLVPGFSDAAIRVQNAPGSVIGGFDVSSATSLPLPPRSASGWRLPMGSASCATT